MTFDVNVVYILNFKDCLGVHIMTIFELVVVTLVYMGRHSKRYLWCIFLGVKSTWLWKCINYEAQCPINYIWGTMLKNSDTFVKLVWIKTLFLIYSFPMSIGYISRKYKNTFSLWRLDCKVYATLPKFYSIMFVW